MNENEEVYIEEDLLENTTFDEDILSSDSADTLEDKLDRVEALLNEEISNRDQEELEEGFRSEPIMLNTSSGVVDPNYSQYIYDLLTDSTIKVQIVEENTIFDKQLNDYTVLESVSVLGLMLALGIFIGSFINRYTFKRR